MYRMYLLKHSIHPLNTHRVHPRASVTTPQTNDLNGYGRDPRGYQKYQTGEVTDYSEPLCPDKHQNVTFCSFFTSLLLRWSAHSCLHGAPDQGSPPLALLSTWESRVPALGIAATTTKSVHKCCIRPLEYFYLFCRATNGLQSTPYDSRSCHHLLPSSPLPPSPLLHALRSATQIDPARLRQLARYVHT